MDLHNDFFLNPVPTCRKIEDVLLVCEETGLLGGTFFALDGCKLPSNASKEWEDLRLGAEEREDGEEGYGAFEEAGGSR